MFESEPGGLLVTWRSPVWPLEANAPLQRLGDHRRDYLSYEGPVSNDRGSVQRIGKGTFEWLSREAVKVVIRLLEPEPATWIITDGLAIRA
jgi:hypothetical protein